MHTERKIIITIIVIAFSVSCRTQSRSPGETYKAFYAAAKKRDGAAMKPFIVNSALTLYEARAKNSNQTVEEYLAQVVAPTFTTRLPEEVPDARIGENTSSFQIRTTDGTSFVLMLMKENGEWKIINPY